MVTQHTNKKMMITTAITNKEYDMIGLRVWAINNKFMRHGVVSKAQGRISKALYTTSLIVPDLGVCAMLGYILRLKRYPSLWIKKTLQNWKDWRVFRW